MLALRFLAVDGCPISVSRRVLSVDVGLAPVTTSGSTVGTGNRGVTRLESHLSVLGLTISLVRGLITPEGTGITLDGFRVSLDGAPLPILWTHREGVPSSSRPQSLID